MNVLSLFSGIGGIDLGLECAGMTVVGQVEIDPYCQRVLAKHWPGVPLHDDVRTAVEWWQSELRPNVDLVAGGFPCTDISNAGRRAGIDGEQSGLWAWMCHTIRELRPRYALLENVSAILVRGIDSVAADLAACGYDLQWDCIPAAAVGAPHRRDRWFGVAHTNGKGLETNERTTIQEPVGRPTGTCLTSSGTVGDPTSVGRGQGRPGRPTRPGSDGTAQQTETLADADQSGWNGRSRVFRPGRWGQHPHSGWWTTEPDVDRGTHGLSPELDGTAPWEKGIPRTAVGIPNRVHRLKALGNAVVPQVAEHVGRLILEYDLQKDIA